MKFAIRDDDICFFTTPDKLENVYGFIDSGPVSLSVVPYTVPMHGDTFPFGEGLLEKQYDIGENTELITYLKHGVNTKKYEILLHGSTHQNKKINDRWVSEMIYKDKTMILEELTKGKAYLEILLNCRIKVFVAPYNQINTKAILAIEKLGMDYSGIIHHRDRPINWKYIKNYLFRWTYRVFTGVNYGGILDFGRHKELIAYPLGDFEKLKRLYQLCKANNNPFVICTHYWDIIKNEKTRNCLKSIVTYALEDGADLVKLSDCFNR